MLAHPTYNIVAVHKTKRELTIRDQIRAVAIARRQLNGVGFEGGQEGLRTLIAPKDKQRRDFGGCRAEQGICDDGLAAPLRGCISEHRFGLCASILVNNE